MPTRRRKAERQTEGQRELIRQIEAYGGEGYVVVVKVGPHESDAMVMPDERFPKVFRANYEAVDYARHGYPKGLGPSAKLRVWRITKEGDRFVREVIAIPPPRVAVRDSNRRRRVQERVYASRRAPREVTRHIGGLEVTFRFHPRSGLWGSTVHGKSGGTLPGPSRSSLEETEAAVRGLLRHAAAKS